MIPSGLSLSRLIHIALTSHHTIALLADGELRQMDGSLPHPFASALHQQRLSFASEENPILSTSTDSIEKKEIFNDEITLCDPGNRSLRCAGWVQPARSWNSIRTDESGIHPDDR